MVYLIYIVFFFALGFCLGWMYVKVKLHTLNDYNQMYSHLTCEIVSRMTKAMRSLRMEQDDIDRVIDRMGCKIMPTSVLTPPPTPPEKPAKPKRDFDKDPYTMDEVIRRLTPHDDQSGEWYCSARQPKMAWRLDKVDAEGLIVCKTVHDMREHTISKAPPIYPSSTVEGLAENIIKYNFRFVADFDKSEWN